MSDIIISSVTPDSFVYNPLTLSVSELYKGPTYSPLNPMVVTTTSKIAPSFVVTTDRFNNIRLSVPQPVIPIFTDLNSKEEVREEMVDYVKAKLLDKWLYKDLSEVLSYLTISDGKVKPSASSSSKDDSRDIMTKKIKYLEDNIITHRLIRKVVAKYIDETNTMWVDIPTNTYYLKEVLKSKLIRLLKAAASNK